MKVLIVEDNAEMSRALTRTLSKIDPTIQVEWMESAEHALQKLGDTARDHGCAYDLVIADVYLSGAKTGLHLWRYCERCLPDTECLLMSGMGVESFFHALGATEVAPPFLPKPFSTSEFRETVECILHYKEELTDA